MMLKKSNHFNTSMASYFLHELLPSCAVTDQKRASRKKLAACASGHEYFQLSLGNHIPQRLKRNMMPKVRRQGAFSFVKQGTRPLAPICKKYIAQRSTPLRRIGRLAKLIAMVKLDEFRVSKQVNHASSLDQGVRKKMCNEI